MEILYVFIKTLFFYFVITIVYRVMGKREVGELSVIDLVVSILIAEFAAISIENYKNSIFLTLVPILTIVVIQLLVAKISLKSENLRNAVDGKPSVIIKKGKINFKEMLTQRYNLDDLLTQLRSNGIASIEEVDYAILETSGKLSVFPKTNSESGPYPLPLILDGSVEEDTLRQIKKNKTWLDNMLKKQNTNLKDVFYGFYRNNSLYLIKNENIK